MIVNKLGVSEVNNLTELNNIEMKFKGQRVKVINTTGDAIATGNSYYDYDGFNWILDKNEVFNYSIDNKLKSNDTTLDSMQEVVDFVKILDNKNRIIKTVVTQATTSTTLANVTALVLPVEANSVYEIECYVTFRSSATTNGINLGLITPPNTINNVEIVVPITNTAAATQLRTIFPNNAIASNLGNVTGTGVSAANNNQTGIIRGVISTGNLSGNCQIQFASEVNGNTITIQTNSMLLLKKII